MEIRKPIITHALIPRSIFVVLISLITLGCKNVDLRQINDAIAQIQQPLDEKTVVAGLKQALEVSTGNSTAKTSQKDGFNKNPLIHIPIPQDLQKVTNALNRIGLNQYVDDFETQMNRAAESASGTAKTVFIESISRMSVTDAWGILQGPEDAATQYFRNDTEQQLRVKFQPIIKSSMSKVGVYADYKRLLAAYNTIPFTQKPDLDLEKYVMQKTLDGLFVLVAEEEAKIRNNPAARVTDLLRKVFK